MSLWLSLICHSCRLLHEENRCMCKAYALHETFWHLGNEWVCAALLIQSEIQISDVKASAREQVPVLHFCSSTELLSVGKCRNPNFEFRSQPLNSLRV